MKQFLAETEITFNTKTHVLEIFKLDDEGDGRQYYRATIGKVRNVDLYKYEGNWIDRQHGKSDLATEIGRIIEKEFS